MNKHTSDSFEFQQNEEIWKPVLGYEGVYEVSSFGQIRRVETQRILRPAYDKRGYASLGLCMNGKPTQHKVHALVAESFLGKRSPNQVVNHIDNNPRNNHISNLEITTYKGNSHHALKQGRYGKHNITPERAAEIVGYLNQTDPYLNMEEIAVIMGLPVHVIRYTARNLRVLNAISGTEYVRHETFGGYRPRINKHANKDEIVKAVIEEGCDYKEIAQRFGLDRGNAWRVVKRIKTEHAGDAV